MAVWGNKSGIFLRDKSISKMGDLSGQLLKRGNDDTTSITKKKIPLEILFPSSYSKSDKTLAPAYRLGGARGFIPLFPILFFFALLLPSQTLLICFLLWVIGFSPGAVLEGDDHWPCLERRRDCGVAVEWRVTFLGPRVRSDLIFSFSDLGQDLLNGGAWSGLDESSILDELPVMALRWGEERYDELC